MRVVRANDDGGEEVSSNSSNNAGRNLKVEALTTVRQLEQFLAKSVARQWYDMDRATFNFVQRIKAEAPMDFVYDVSLIKQLRTMLHYISVYFNPYSNFCISSSTTSTKMAFCTSSAATAALASG